jgi:hypothetical protein
MSLSAREPTSHENHPRPTVFFSFPSLFSLPGEDESPRRVGKETGPGSRDGRGAPPLLAGKSSPGDRWRAAPYVDGWMTTREREREVDIYVCVYISQEGFSVNALFGWILRCILRFQSLWKNERTDERSDERKSRTEGGFSTGVLFIRSSIHSFIHSRKDREIDRERR